MKLRPMKKPKRALVPLAQSIEKLERFDDTTLGARLQEYLGESAHQGWDGFARQDLTGIRVLLEDFVLFCENYV